VKQRCAARQPGKSSRAQACTAREISEQTYYRWRREGLKVLQKQSKRARLWLNGGSVVRLKPLFPQHVWSYDFLPEAEDRTHRYLVIDEGFHFQFESGEEGQSEIRSGLGSKEFRLDARKSAESQPYFTFGYLIIVTEVAYFAVAAAITMLCIRVDEDYF
jgi:hypothetical protein